MTKAHVEKRFEQAHAAYRKLRDSMFLPGLTLAQQQKIMQTQDFQVWSRIKCNQLSRITRRCVRMMANAS